MNKEISEPYELSLLKKNINLKKLINLFLLTPKVCDPICHIIKSFCFSKYPK